MKRIFVSDLHIGQPLSRAFEILHELNTNIQFDELYLVGDIVDLWATSFKSIEKKHVKELSLLKQLCNKVHVYIIGNHDEHIMKYLPEFVFTDSTVIEISGKKVKLIHGHEYDFLIKDFYWGSRIFTWIKDIIMKITGHDVIKVSMSEKKNTKTYSFLMDVVKKKAAETNKGFDVLVMGHTHVPCIEMVGTLQYVNCGDWIDSFTYILEENGNFQLIKLNI